MPEGCEIRPMAFAEIIAQAYQKAEDEHAEDSADEPS